MKASLNTILGNSPSVVLMSEEPLAGSRVVVRPDLAIHKWYIEFEVPPGCVPHQLLRDGRIIRGLPRAQAWMWAFESPTEATAFASQLGYSVAPVPS